MEIKILFNSEALKGSLCTGWGLSFLIDNKILFDAGEKGDFLLDNMNKLKVNLSAIECVVVSHDHWDHTGGLWALLKQRKNIDIYGCPGFSDTFKEKVLSSKGRLIENAGWFQISKNIFITGEIKGVYKNQEISEQALVVSTENGLTVITGCSHPGILEILELIQAKIPKKKFYAVLGGFHLMNKLPRKVDALVDAFAAFDVEKVGPTHCSGDYAKQAFKKRYGTDFLSSKAGEILNV